MSKLRESAKRMPSVENSAEKKLNIHIEGKF
jgi:hypothetical protein